MSFPYPGSSRPGDSPGVQRPGGLRKHHTSASSEAVLQTTPKSPNLPLTNPPQAPSFNKRRNTLPAPVAGSASINRTVFGAL